MKLIRKTADWLNYPVTEGIWSNKPVRRWMFWHPGSGLGGGLIGGAIITLIIIVAKAYK